MTGKETVYFLAVLAVGEIVATVLYLLISRIMHRGRVNKISMRSILKGMLERSFLFLALANGFPHAMTVFGALKIATRLRDKDDRITNDYFLIGNLLSVMLAMIYFLVWKSI